MHMENRTQLIRNNLASWWKNFSRPKLSVKNQIFFVKRLSFLLRADVPILESIQMIRNQTTSKGFAHVLDSVLEDIANGQSLSGSLGKFKNVFSNFAIHIIEFGENTGMLSENLEYLALEMNKRRMLTRKVIGAFIYPAIVTAATFGITAFLMIYLFPKIMPVFKSLHITLPLSTRIVIFLSDFIRHKGFFIILFIFIGTVSFFIAQNKISKFRLYLDRLILRIPLLGTMVKHYNLANSTRTLGLLLKSGVTISDALPITVKTAGNTAYKNIFVRLTPIVDRGEKMSVFFAGNKFLFPDVFTQIIAVGERSGNLPHSCIYLSEMYEEEVDEFTKNLSSIIEPVLMILMGILVGFIAISIITPIYGITQNLHG